MQLRMAKMTEIKKLELLRDQMGEKGHIIIFLVGMGFILIAVLLVSIASFIPRPPYGDPGYYTWGTTMATLADVRNLFINLGLVLIPVALYIGATMSKNTSEHAQRGMFISMGLVLMGFIGYMIYTSIMGMIYY